MTPSPESESKNNDILLDAILKLETREELYEFFNDLLTVKELDEFGHRFAVARMLDEGKIYAEIQKATGASSATISRVKRALEYGASGYKKAIYKLKNSQK